MRKFWSRKFLGLPMVVVLIVAVLLSGGVVFAAYNIFSGDVDVTVQAPVRVVYNDCSANSEWDSGTLTVEMYAGQEAWVEFYLFNDANPTAITVTPTSSLTAYPTGGQGEISGTWAPSPPVSLNGLGPHSVTFTVSATQSAPEGLYEWTIGFER